MPSTCSWNDTSQAEVRCPISVFTHFIWLTLVFQAYAHTLKAFYKAYPEFASNDLYLSGESYAGQCKP